MKLDFCIVGAMKAGTTALYSSLNQHPKILFPHIKEPGFFSRDERFNRGIRWYESLFPASNANQLLGEASTCYSRSAVYPNAAVRLHSHSPDLKLIYIMRHPVERSISHYVHEMQIRHIQDRPLASLEDFLWNDAEVLSAGLYINEIKHLLKYFRREQLLLLRFDELTSCPDKLLAQVWKFLDLMPLRLDASAENVSNPRGQYIALWAAERRLAQVRELPIFRRATQLIPPQIRRRFRSALRSILANSAFGRKKALGFLNGLEKPSKHVRLRLLEYYASSTDELESMTGWDLSGWRN